MCCDRDWGGGGRGEIGRREEGERKGEREGETDNGVCMHACMQRLYVYLSTSPSQRMIAHLVVVRDGVGDKLLLELGAVLGVGRGRDLDV